MKAREVLWLIAVVLVASFVWGFTKAAASDILSGDLRVVVEVR